MRFYEKYFKNNYEELITYYPRFYRDVYEMVEILKAQGRITDQLEDDIEQTYLNNFIDYADEATIENLEKFLMIGLNKSRTLEERRRLVKSYFVGSGKVSATMLKEMIESYTNAPVEVLFEPSDEKGNNTLYINFQRGKEPTLYMSDISVLLGKKIPAHIQWQAAVTYRFPIGIGVKRTHYKYGYDLCGTKPEIAMLGQIITQASVTQAKSSSHTMDYRITAETEELTGQYPDKALKGVIRRTEAVTVPGVESYVTGYKNPSEDAGEAGTWPEMAALGNNSEISAGIGAKATNYGVDYIYCGTKFTQG